MLDQRSKARVEELKSMAAGLPEAAEDLFAALGVDPKSPEGGELTANRLQSLVMCS